MATTKRKTSKSARRPVVKTKTAQVQPEKARRGVSALEIILLVLLVGLVAFLLVRYAKPVSVSPQATEAPAQPQNFCGQARDLGPWAPSSNGIGETFEVTATLDDSTGIVLGLWFPDGNTPWGQKEITTFIEPGLSIEVQNGAGRGFDYPVGCSSSEVDSQLADHMVQRKLDTNYNGYVDVDELIRLGLVKVRFDRRGQ